MLARPGFFIDTLPTAMLRALLASVLTLATATAQDRPNIIFFFVDDLGYGDIGCFWQDQRTNPKKFDTPALDAMAAEGAKLTHHYIPAPVCAPSRGSLLQGRHQGHCDIRDSQFDKPLPPNHNIASTLKAAGYRTIHIGKDGLAGGESSTNLTGTGSQNLASHPLDRGFDRFFGYLFHVDGHEHFPRNGTTDKSAFIYDDYRQITDASADLYTTDAWTAAAKKEIIDEATDGDDQPFFLYLAYDTPHFKMQRPAVAYPPLDNDGDPLTGGIQWTTATDGTGKVRYASTADGSGVVDAFTHPDIPAGWSNSEKQHVGMIRRIDESIADILRTLQDLGIDDNTLCVFTTDNGPHNEGNNPRTFESYANLEGVKRDMWEGGIRAPAIVRWPGKIAGATNNPANIHEISYPIALWDWMPTFCDLAGVTAPAYCDGVSIAPTLTGTGTQRDKGYLYFEFQASGNTPDWPEFPNHRNAPKGQMQCLRIGNHMGIRTAIATGNENFQIYDVTTDPGQANNLAATLPALQTEMKYLALAARRPGAGVSRPYDTLPLPPRGPATTAPGVKWGTFTDPAATWDWVPEFRDLTPHASGTSTTPDLAVRPADEHFGIAFTGYLQVPTAGAYTFHLISDTGAQLWLHDGHVIDDDFNHSGNASSTPVQLAAGLHPYRLYYRHRTGTRNLAFEWTGPGIPRQPVPASALRIEAPVSPTANDDNATTQLDQSILIDVLANDADDGLPSPLSIQSLTTPDHGSAIIESGQIRYTPPTGFLGTATFSYTITDGESTDSAIVTITVSDDPYSPPQAKPDLAYARPGAALFIPVLLNDLDDGLPAALSIASVTAPATGSAVIQGTGILFTAPSNFTGHTAFSYTLTDGGPTTSSTTVTVVASPADEWWLPLDEAAGNIVTDATGKATTIANPPAARWTPGRFGSALNFSGSAGEHLNLTGFTGITGTAARTVSAWIKTTGTGQYPIIAWGPNSSGAKWTFLTQNGRLRIEVTGGFREGSTLINDGQWHHVAATFANDGTPDVLDVQLYIDGVPETSFATQGARTLATTASIDVRVGSDVQDRFFLGTLDEARIFPRALSPAEILSLATATSASTDSSLWHYRFFADAAPDSTDWNRDDDKDGFSRFLEYALGGSPHVADLSIAPFLERSGNTYDFIFNRRRSGLSPASYTAESSTNLESPSWLPLGSPAVTPHPDLPDYDRLRVPVPPSDPRRFVRLRVDF
jgi:arylsulfatase A-like enzyme